jgi:hypothetical protein
LGLIEIIELIKGVLAFPGIVLEFVKLLKSTPQENHEAILKRVREEASAFEETGRPTW